MATVHVRLDLEDEPAELVARGLHGLPGQGVRVGERRGRQAQEVLEEGLHAKVRERRAKEDRRQPAVAHGIQVELVVCPVQELDVVHQVLVVLGADELVECGIAQLGLHLGDLLRGVGMAVALEGDHVTRRAVKDALEVAPGPDGPVHGVGADAQHVLDLLHELEGVADVVVELVHEGEDGDVAQGADLEELDGLGLHALGAVDYHDRGVSRHQGAVGILREVLVAGGIQDVHAAAAVGELQDRGGDGDAALLLDVHPVGDGVARAGLALYGAGRLDGAGVEEELLGERGLARVRVADDGEGTPGGDLLGQAWHGHPLRAVSGDRRSHGRLFAGRRRYCSDPGPVGRAAHKTARSAWGRQSPRRRVGREWAAPRDAPRHRPKGKNVVL